MSLTALIIVSLFLFIALFLMIKQGIAGAREQGRLEKEIEDARDSDEVQKDYVIISSRPTANADFILERMRGNPPPANK